MSAHTAAPASDMQVSLAPSQLLPPVVSAYLPSAPPPSLVDAGKQRPEHISSIQAMSKAGEVQSMQVKKRLHVTDGVRLAQRKKKRSAAAAAAAAAAADGGGASSGLAVREMPDRLDIDLPESGLVNQLLGLEKRLDATIARKHVELQHALHPTRQMPQVIRLFLWHEHTTPITHEELINGVTPHDKPECDAWLLKMQGQVLDAEEGVVPAAAAAAGPAAARSLSNYLSAVVIQIEGKTTSNDAAAAAASSSVSFSSAAASPPCETVEWRKHSAVALSDGIEIRRRGAGDVHLQINLFLDYSPARFRLSAALSHALGFPLQAPNPLPAHAQPQQPNPFPLMETQSNVLAAFWEYVQKHKLQDAQNPTSIKCDPVLVNLFGVSELPVSSVLSFLQLHLSPAAAEPIVIPYHIRPTITPTPPPFAASFHSVATPAPSPSPVTCYDILTYLPVQPSLADTYRDATAHSGLKSLPPPTIPPVMTRHTEKLVELMLEIDKCNRRREFLQSFSEAPTQVLQLLVAQQAKDQLLIIGATGVDDELERRAEYYHAEWQHDACDRMLAEEATNAANAMQSSAAMFDETTDE